jgi:peptidyl-prolyl cis-trans isomerase B (cyclophilin B)
MFGWNGRTLILGLAVGALATGTAWAADPPAPAATKEKAPAVAKEKAATAAKEKVSAAADEVGIIETTKGKMVVEFWPKEAPETVANFKKLARQGFYDGTGFHRIIQNFMIQGGDPNSKNPKALDLGTGGPGYTIKDEFNSHQHVKGVLSMAHTGAPNSAGSQFFIMHGTAAHLDGQYTAFGHLIQGMDVLDAIAATPVEGNPTMRGEMSKPKEWTTVKTVRIVPRAALSGQAKATEAKQTGAAKATQAKASAAKTHKAGMEAVKAGMGEPKGATLPTESAPKDSAAGSTTK